MENTSGDSLRPKAKRIATRPAEMAQRFWASAQDELGVAGTLLLPGRYFASALHAHQAAEDALKAACWHLRAEEPPWSHNLVLLRTLLVDRVDAIPATVRTETDRLDPLYGLARYPSSNLGDPRPSEYIDEEQARAAVAAAEQVMAWVEELLRLPAGRPHRTKKS